MYKTILIVTLLCPIAVAQNEPRAPATLVVRLPSDAKIWLDDYASSQTGPQRIFTTSPLERNASYYYTVRIELMREGTKITAVKQVRVRAGETTAVDFAEPQAIRVAPKKDVEAKAKPKDSGLSQREQELLDLTNRERKKAGLEALQHNAKLAQAARSHSENMARQQKLDHVLDDKSPDDRIRATGYRGFNWGENIAFGMPTPAGAIEVWMNSKGHRANILSEGFTELGIGIAVDSRGVPYYTQVFGRR
jgi:uncharacterized protein (TIGR03000 family)